MTRIALLASLERALERLLALLSVLTAAPLAAHALAAGPAQELPPPPAPGEPNAGAQESVEPGSHPLRLPPGVELREYNVVWFCSDQHRYDLMGCAGDPVVRTPNLDRFAETAIRLDHMYSQYPLCAPSRASFISGQYPRAHRVRYNGIPMPLETPRIARTLRKYGWSTGCVGNAEAEPRIAELNGYDLYDIQNGYFQWARERGFDGTTWFATNSALGREQGLGGHRYGVLEYDSSKHYSTWVARTACHALERLKEDRFFLWIGDRMPHPPYLVPTDYVDMYDPESIPMPPSIDREGEIPFEELKRAHAAYYALTTLMDANFGRVLDKIDELGLTEDTIVIYTTDHGNLLGRHGQLGKGRFYDDDTRLPFMIRYPGQKAAGVVNEGLAEQVDVMPTILDLLGVPAPRGVQGRSLVRMLEGEEPGRDAAFGDMSSEKRQWQMVRTHAYKLIYKNSEPNLMFDLSNDPQEMVNVYDDPNHAEAREDLMRRLFEWNVHTVDVTSPDLYRNPREAQAYLDAYYGGRRR